MKLNLHIIVFLVLVLVSCKAKISMSGASIPPEAKTISVGFFKNNTTLGAPSLAQRFTERLKDVVSQQTNLALVKVNGDLQFEGYIADYNVVPIAAQTPDQATKNRMTITINVIYKNKFDAKRNFEQNFTRFADFNANENVAAKEPELVQEIYKLITEDIFTRAFNDW